MFFTQEYSLRRVQDSHPELKINNIIAFDFCGFVDELINDRLLYDGFWTIHYNYDFTNNIELDYFGTRIPFSAQHKNVIDHEHNVWFKYIGPASAWVYSGSQPVSCTFWGFKYEIDNVPPPSNTPVPPPVYYVSQFWYVVDNMNLYFNSVLEGGDKLKVSFTVDNLKDGCYDLDSTAIVTADQELRLNASISPGCPSLGISRVVSIKYPNDYGVQLKFMKYVRNAVDGVVLCYYEIIQERENLQLITNSISAVGVPHTVSVDGNTVVISVPIANENTWSQIKWTVANNPDPLSASFIHEFVNDKGFTGFNSLTARYTNVSGNPCSGSAKTVYLKKPATTFASGVPVYPDPDSSTKFSIQTNQIAVASVGGQIFSLGISVPIDGGPSFNFIAAPLGNC